MDIVYQPISGYWDTLLPPVLPSEGAGNASFWSATKQAWQNMQQNAKDTARQQDTKQEFSQQQLLEEERRTQQRENFVQAAQHALRQRLQAHPTDPELMRQQLRRLSDSM